MSQRTETEAIVKAGQPTAWRAIGLSTGVTVVAVVGIALGWLVMWSANVRLAPDPVADARQAALEAEQARAKRDAARFAALGPAGPALDMNAVGRGKRLYDAACITCHGPEGRGVPKMGKDLVEGRFSLKTSDHDLAAFIAAGRTADDRLNTTGMPMPARGGRTDFADKDLTDIVTYLRALQDPRRVTGAIPEVRVAVLDDEEDAPAVQPVANVQPATPAGPAATVASAPATDVAAPTLALDPAAITRGKKVYNSCIACHGRTGEGVAKVGADLKHSDFVKKKTDEELLAFIKKGRQPGDPDSKLNLAMPAKGGNPSLKDNQIQDVIVYLRSLQQAAADAK